MYWPEPRVFHTLSGPCSFPHQRLPCHLATQAPAEDMSKKRARVFDQQGPLLPGKKRKQITKTD